METKVKSEITSQDIKEKVDQAIHECWNLIVKRVDELGLKDNGARWLFTQRVVNVLWLRAHPQAVYVHFENEKERLGEYENRT